MNSPERFVFWAMGSEGTFHLYDASVATAQAAEAEVFRIEQRYSRYRDDSVLAQINQVAAAGGSLEVDDETGALLDYAFACHRKSGGLFDITTGILRRAWDFSSGRAPELAEVARWLPFVGLDKLHWERPHLSFPLAGMELDFGGIGKEYAADRVAALCAEAEVKHGLIDLGGDLSAIGPRPDGSPWQVQIRNPHAPEQCLAILPLSFGGLATSGDYARYVMLDGLRHGHILSPVTGWPIRGLTSASVVADSCLLAGSVATIALLKGSGGAAWLSELGMSCLWTDVEGRLGKC